MKSFAPCLVVMLAGLALGVAGGFAWVTGDAYTGEHVRAYGSVAVVPVAAASIEPAAIDLPQIQLASDVTESRGGEAT